MRGYYERFNQLASAGHIPVQDRDNREAAYREAVAKLGVAASDIAAARAPGACQRVTAREARDRLEQSRQACTAAQATVVRAEAAQLQPDIATDRSSALEQPREQAAAKLRPSSST